MKTIVFFVLFFVCAGVARGLENDLFKQLEERRGATNAAKKKVAYSAAKRFHDAVTWEVTITPASGHLISYDSTNEHKGALDLPHTAKKRVEIWRAWPLDAFGVFAPTEAFVTPLLLMPEYIGTAPDSKMRGLQVEFFDLRAKSVKLFKRSGPVNPATDAGMYASVQVGNLDWLPAEYADAEKEADFTGIMRKDTFNGTFSYMFKVSEDRFLNTNFDVAGRRVSPFATDDSRELLPALAEKVENPAFDMARDNVNAKWRVRYNPKYDLLWCKENANAPATDEFVHGAERDRVETWEISGPPHYVALPNTAKAELKLKVVESTGPMPYPNGLTFTLSPSFTERGAVVASLGGDDFVDPIWQPPYYEIGSQSKRAAPKRAITGAIDIRKTYFDGFLHYVYVESSGRVCDFTYKVTGERL